MAHLLIYQSKSSTILNPSHFYTKTRFFFNEKHGNLKIFKAAAFSWKKKKKIESESVFEMLCVVGFLKKINKL